MSSAPTVRPPSPPAEQSMSCLSVTFVKTVVPHVSAGPFWADAVAGSAIAARTIAATRVLMGTFIRCYLFLGWLVGLSDRPNRIGGRAGERLIAAVDDVVGEGVGLHGRCQRRQPEGILGGAKQRIGVVVGRERCPRRRQPGHRDGANRPVVALRRRGELVEGDDQQ